MSVITQLRDTFVKGSYYETKPVIFKQIGAVAPIRKLCAIINNDNHDKKN